MRISLFNRLPEKGKPHVCDEIITVKEFLSGIKSGRWLQQIEPVRNESDKKKRDWLKRSLPSVTIGGVFKTRLEKELIEHSGFICVDIDHYNDKTSLLEDRYTYAIFKSASGKGLAVMVKINPDKHKESYAWLADYYYLNFGISVDPAPKNVASLRFVSYDPECFVNEKSAKSRTKSKPPKRPKSMPLVLGDDDVSEMVKEAVDLNINLAESYDDYRNLGFALAEGMGEAGRTLYHSLCRVSDKYDSTQCDKQFDISLRGAGKQGITMGSFYHMMNQAGIKPPRKNERAVQVAAVAKKAGRTAEGVAMQLVQMEGMDSGTAKKVADEVFKREDIDLSKLAADPDKLIESLIHWMANNHPLRMNLVTRKIEENGIELTNERINTIYLRARMAFNSKEVTKDLVQSIIFSDIIENFNPIEEYVAKNRHRNSTGNIDAIIDTINTDTPRADLFIRKWLIGIAAAIDGSPVRTVLSLVGGQNTGKTEWFRRLLPDKLKSYYAESKLDAGKDDEILMCEKLIVMDDEMGGKSKQDEKRFKELTSKSTFSLRAPYARHNQDYKRLAILCGTSNDPNVINDPTGNTRILPVNVLSINHEKYNAINKDELFMEVVRLFESGYNHEFDREEIAQLSDISSHFEIIPFERELISKFFKPGMAGGGYAEWLTSSEIKDYIETHTRQRIMNLRRFGLELVNVLGKSEQKKIDNCNTRRYYAIKIESHVTDKTTEDEEPPF